MNSNHSFSLLLVSSLLILMIGCGAQPNNNESHQSPSTGTVTFSLNGSPWVSSGDHPTSEFEVDAITDHNTMVRIEAFAADGSHISITIFRQDGGISTGTYPIMDSGIMGVYETTNQNGWVYLTNALRDNPGSVTISTLTETKVTGSFQFLVRNSAIPDDVLELTNGQFDVTFAKY